MKSNTLFFFLIFLLKKTGTFHMNSFRSDDAPLHRPVGGTGDPHPAAAVIAADAAAPVSRQAAELHEQPITYQGFTCENKACFRAGAAGACDRVCAKPLPEAPAGHRK